MRSVIVRYQFSGKFTHEKGQGGDLRGFMNRAFSGYFTYDAAGYDPLNPYHFWSKSEVTLESDKHRCSLNGESVGVLSKSDTLRLDDYHETGFARGESRHWGLTLRMADETDPVNPISAERISGAYFHLNDRSNKDRDGIGPRSVAAGGPVDDLHIIIRPIRKDMSACRIWHFKVETYEALIHLFHRQRYVGKIAFLKEGETRAGREPLNFPKDGQPILYCSISRLNEIINLLRAKTPLEHILNDLEKGSLSAPCKGRGHGEGGIIT